MLWLAYVFLGGIVLVIGLIIYLFTKFWTGFFTLFIDDVIKPMNEPSIDELKFMFGGLATEIWGEEDEI